MKNTKTVYILGAGFSMPAGLPSQAALIKKMLEAEVSSKRKFKNFLNKTLDFKLDSEFQFDLEDIYTPIDKTLVNKTSFKNLTYEDVITLRKHIDSLIANVISTEQKEENLQQDYIKKFSKFIVQETKGRIENEKHDPIAIITTNWDTLLDDAIQKELNSCLDNANNEQKKNGFIGVVDYCCYVSSLDEDGFDNKKIKPGLYAIAKGGFNVKLLKLHGSINWLQCPKCQRLFVRDFDSIYKPSQKYYCNKYCEKNHSELKNSKSSELYLNLIMPTFLKDFSNFQNKLIWHNAALELSEADKVVFIGYSLPQADFEFRNLLFKNVRKNAKIEIVLHESDDPSSYCQNTKWITAGHRFDTFFSGKKYKEFYYYGVENYFKNNLKWH